MHRLPQQGKCSQAAARLDSQTSSHPHGLLSFAQRHRILWRDECLGFVNGLDLDREPEGRVWPPKARLSRSIRRQIQGAVL